MSKVWGLQDEGPINLSIIVMKIDTRGQNLLNALNY